MNPTPPEIVCNGPLTGCAAPEHFWGVVLIVGSAAVVLGLLHYSNDF